MKSRLLSCAAFAVLVSIASAQPAVLPGVTLKASEVFNLWPGAAPGETGAFGPEHVLPDRPRPFDQITDVSVPTLSVFLPPKDKANGTAILVIPGGGLERLAIEHEGYEVAQWLNDQGIAAFLLKYRVPARSQEQRWKAGLQDAQRAMGLVRAGAAKWGIDPDSIGTIGFSAGGEINVMLAVYGERQYAPVDDTDRQPTRPAFNIVMYGGGFADIRANELRPDILSRITKDTPPMFIAHAFDDAALSSVILMGALKRANVASELHIFGAGGHGFGVRDSGLPLAHWRELCLNWLGWQGFLDPAFTRAFAGKYRQAYAEGGTGLPRFSAGAAHAGVDQAYVAQHRLVRAAVAHGDEIAGYKGAYTSAASQSANSVDGAQHGVLFKSGRLDAAAQPTVVPVEAKRPILVETEIGYVIAVDIGTELLTPRQAMSAVESLVPVIELPVNVGAISDGKANAADVIAANVGSNRYIVGAPVAPRAVGDTDKVAVSLTLDGKELHHSTGAEVKDGQARNLMTLLNQVLAQGQVLHKGDLIICGALGGAKPGEKGIYRADYGPLGKIEFELR